MGREVRRVPLDFDWPLNKTWEGFLNPHYTGHRLPCPHCNGTGSNLYGQYLNDQWYGRIAFKPEDNGSVPFGTDHPAVQRLARRNIESGIKSIRQTPDPEDRYDFSGRKAALHYRHFYGIDIEKYPEEAVELEAQRLCDQCFNNSWSHHLNQADVQALVDDDRLWDYTRRPLRPITEEDIRTYAYFLWLEAGSPEGRDIEFWEKSVEDHGRHWLPYRNGYVPTAQEVNENGICGIGHDAINSWVVIRSRAERDGKTTTCEHCEGEGNYWDSLENQKLCDEWRQTEPPVGEAYQIWETVSEGSPISPPFADPKDLAEYMSHTRWGGDKGTPAETWLKFILGPGWAPSAISTPETGFVSGVEGVVALQEDQ